MAKQNRNKKGFEMVFSRITMSFGILWLMV
jgi:hypothetical protein